MTVVVPDIDHLVLHAPELAELTRAVLAQDLAATLALDEAYLRTAAALPFGRPFTFVEQYDGAMVHDVRPVAGREAERSSRGRAPLTVHTDDAFLLRDARPEFMALLGVLNPQRVPTQLIRINDVVERLDAETVAALKQPWFTFARPASFAVGDSAQPVARPLLQERHDGLLEASFATQTAIAPTADEVAALYLEAFSNAVEHAPRQDILLGPGDMVVFSNLRCLHGRPAVQADRWLKRLYLRRDHRELERLAATPKADVYTAARVVDRL